MKANLLIKTLNDILESLNFKFKDREINIWTNVTLKTK